MQFRGCPSAGKHDLGTKSCRRKVNKLTKFPVYLDQHSRLRKDTRTKEGSLRIRTSSTDPHTAHGCPRIF